MNIFGYCDWRLVMFGRREDLISVQVAFGSREGQGFEKLFPGQTTGQILKRGMQ